MSSFIFLLNHHIVHCFVFYIKSLESVGYVCGSYHSL